MYKVFQIWPGLIVCKQVTICPGHIWTTLYTVLATGPVRLRTCVCVCVCDLRYSGVPSSCALWHRAARDSRFNISWTSCPLKVGPIGNLETSMRTFLTSWPLRMRPIGLETSVKISLPFWPLKTGPTGSLETSASNHLTPHYNPTNSLTFFTNVAFFLCVGDSGDFWLECFNSTLKALVSSETSVTLSQRHSVLLHTWMLLEPRNLEVQYLF
jgi:hypothetical protein